MTSKHTQILILVSAAIILSTSCSPPASAPPPPSATALSPGAAATPAPAVKPAPAETATAPGGVAPAPVRTPVQTGPIVLTVVPIPQSEPSIGKDKSSMNGVPIPTPLDPPMEKIVQQAKEDLAKRLTVQVDQINLVELQSVTWPDGSLGCPQPGMAYIQIQVDGLLIRLSAGGNLYEYHSGGARAPFLCKPGP